MTAEPIPIGIVGLNFGQQIVETLVAGGAAPWLRLAAVCDLDPAKADALASRYSVQAHPTLESLLADSSIPAIGLFTGPVGRAALIRKIIRARKHVLTTKPFESDATSALEVLLEAQALGRVVHLNSPGPTLPRDLAQIQQWREKHQLGVPVGARADVWASYREKADGTWYDDPARCPAAPIFRLGIYLVNDLLRIFGPVSGVTLQQSRLLTGRPTADNAQLGLQFENGALGSVFASFCIDDGDFYRNSLILNFENGTVYRNAGPERSASASALALVRRRGKTREIVERSQIECGSGAYDWESFARAIRGETLKNATMPEDIVAGLRVLELMSRQSGATKGLARH